MPIGAIANNIAKISGAKGVVTNVGNACAASTISIEYACDLIRAGVGDAFIVGGSDSFSALALVDLQHYTHLIQTHVHHTTRVRA